MTTPFRENLKINLETMTRCGGSCMGCVLGEGERRDASPWLPAWLAQIEPFVASYIAGHHSRWTPLETSINCGQGDHLLLDPSDLRQIVRFMHRAGAGRAIGFMTASAVGKTTHVAAAVDAIRDESLRLSQPVWIDLVVDPVKTRIDHFASTYADNIGLIRNAFGEVDLNINIGPDTIAVVSPEDVNAFIADNAIMRFSLNLTPTPASATAFKAAWPAIIAWIQHFLAIFEPGKDCEFNIGQELAVSIVQHVGGGAEWPETARHVERAAQRSIHLDRTGFIGHTQAGFGDIAFSHRVGWRPSHLLPTNGEDAYDLVGDSARRFAASVMRMFQTHQTCMGCEYARICPRVGVGAIRSAVPDQDGCPSGLRDLIGSVAGRGEDLKDMMCAKDFSYVPRGFADTVRANARAISVRDLAKMDFTSLASGD